jgi:phage regulator Rha-like protein
VCIEKKIDCGQVQLRFSAEKVLIARSVFPSTDTIFSDLLLLLRTTNSSPAIARSVDRARRYIRRSTERLKCDKSLPKKLKQLQRMLQVKT